MNVEDFCSTHSNYTLTTKLFKYRIFQKLSKDFGFHRNQCKMQIMYGSAHGCCCINFQNRFHLFIVHTSFFHFASCLYAEITFSAVQITTGKLKFRKIENMQLWHFVSSVTKKKKKKKEKKKKRKKNWYQIKA